MLSQVAGTRVQINSGAVNGLRRGWFPEAPPGGPSRLGLLLLGRAEQEPSACEGTLEQGCAGAVLNNPPAAAPALMTERIPAVLPAQVLYLQ